jgi:hypothetical protein
MGRDLVLLSVSIDPAHDTPAVLAKYAATWKADAKSWHFLTGPEPDVKSGVPQVRSELLAGRRGPDAFLAHHHYRPAGELAANFEGNEFTAEQLGDLWRLFWVNGNSVYAFIDLELALG